MSPELYTHLHIVSAILLVGATFYMTGLAPNGSKRTWMILSGVLSLIVFIAAMGIWGKRYDMVTHLWIVLKIVIWLAISALGGIAWRKHEQRSLWFTLTAVLTVAAILLARLKPGMMAQ